MSQLSHVSTGSSIGRYRAVWVGYALTLAAFLVFGSSLRHFFSQDDFVFLLRASRVSSIADFVSAFLAGDHFYRPVPRVGFFVPMYQLFGLDAAGYHAVSLLTHTANSLLVYALAFWLSRDRFIGMAAGIIYASHATVAFLAVHWVSGIQDLSVAFWCLVSLWLYTRFHATGRTRWLVFSALGFVPALLSKELAVTLPALLILLDWAASLAQARTFRAGRTLGIAAAYGVVVLAYLAVRSLKTASMIPAEGPYRWNVSVPNVWHNLSYYLSDALYLSGWATAHTGRKLAVGICTLGVLLAVWFSHDRARPVLLLGLGWYIVALSPVLVLNQRVYSFYAYYPMVGMALAMATGARMLGRLVARWLLPRPIYPGVHTALRLLATVLVVFGWLNRSLLAKQTVLSQDPAGILDKSRIAGQALDEITSVHPTLPEGSVLCVAGATDRDIWAFGLGAMFQLYYPLGEVVFTQADQQGHSEVACDYVFHYAP